MKGTTCQTTVGVFDSQAAAEKAVADLKADGFRDSEIGMIWKNAEGETTRADGSGMSKKEKGAASGAAVGAATGAAAGAAVTAGILTGVIPALGPVVALGALGTTLLNAAGGAAAGTLAGALVGWGVSEDDAEYFQNLVAKGKYLVTVQCGSRAGRTSAIYERHGGVYRTPFETPAIA